VTLEAANRAFAEKRYRDAGNEAATVADRWQTTGENPAEALNLAGSAYYMAGEPRRAASYLRRAIAHEPQNHTLKVNLGKALLQDGDREAALCCFQEALALAPSDARAHVAIGSIYLHRGELERAIASFARATRFAPRDATSHYNLGVAALGAGDAEHAVVAFERAAQLAPDHRDAIAKLALCLRQQGDFERAIKYLNTAVEGVHADDARLWHSLALALTALRQPAGAWRAFERAQKLDPNLPGLTQNLAAALHDTGDAAASLSLLSDYQKRHPSDLGAFSAYLMSLHYDSDRSMSEIFAAHQAFGVALKAKYPARPKAPVEPRTVLYEPRCRPRIGFCSADLRRHPVGNFVLPLFEQLSGNAAELVCFSDAAFEDELTASLRGLADEFFVTASASDTELSDTIAAAELDILFELGGHTAGNRLCALVGHPAPVQVSAYGYFNTTGMSAIDYILCDRFQLPEHAERYYTERPARMPDGYICYLAPDYAPDVAPLQNGGETVFGCFNRLAKLSPATVELFAAVLRAVPQSSLLLKTRGLGDSEIDHRVRNWFSRVGVSPSRLILRGGGDHANFLNAYREVDIALDPIPYSGGLTTCEALHMGVPVVTLRGERFASLHSTSHLSNAGFGEGVADDKADYIRRAALLAADRQRLGALRESLRGRLIASKLCDAGRYAENFLKLVARLVK